jgi:hypothetical protein
VAVEQGAAEVAQARPGLPFHPLSGLFFYAPASLFVQTALMSGTGCFFAFARRPLFECTAQQIDEPLYGNLPVGALGTGVLYRDLQDSVFADAVFESGQNFITLFRRQKRRLPDIKREGDAGVAFVDVLSAWSAAAGSRKGQFLFGECEMSVNFQHGYDAVFAILRTCLIRFKIGGWEQFKNT